MIHWSLTHTTLPVKTGYLNGRKAIDLYIGSCILGMYWELLRGKYRLSFLLCSGHEINFATIAR